MQWRNRLIGGPWTNFSWGPWSKQLGMVLLDKSIKVSCHGRQRSTKKARGPWELGALGLCPSRTHGCYATVHMLPWMLYLVKPQFNNWLSPILEPEKINTFEDKILMNDLNFCEIQYSGQLISSLTRQKYFHSFKLQALYIQILLFIYLL